ncbi:MAG TPA: polysaccharide deacetylase family protein [Gemmatimonadaceae bacterium]|nr:polysaccharide deacetylase family protein [Gemmatimonadaceae bacterium]
MNRPRPTTLAFSLAAALVVVVSVMLTLRRGDAATRPEPARFSGSRVVQRMPSLLADAHLPSRVVVDILRDESAASFYTTPGTLDSITGAWQTALTAAGADARVVSATAASADRNARVLVVPSSPCLTVEAREAIDGITMRGGGIIVTGLTGVYDAGCRPIGYGLIVAITGASRADTLDSRPMTYLTLPAGGPLTVDIPPGSRIDLNPGRQLALRLMQRDAFFSDYALQPQPAGNTPLLDVAITHRSYGRGRIVYWGFELRDVVHLPWDRALSAILVRNSVAWAAGLPIGSIEPWPKGRIAAATIAQDVESGFSNAQYALDSLEAAHVRSTFFLTSDLARDYSRLSRDLANAGEVGSHTENHRLLGGLPLGDQRARLAKSENDLARLIGLPVVMGLRPPQEQFDVATMSAWLAVGGRYVFGANDSRSVSPELLPIGHDTLVLIGRVGSDDFAAAAEAHDDPAKTAKILLDEYARYRALGGLYALSYHSQVLATPDLVPALAHVARKLAADTAIWLATTGEIADWWRVRAQLDARITQRSDGFDVVVRNRGERLVGGAVLRVDLPSSRPLGGATAVLLPAHPGSARLLLPPILGNSTRTYQIYYSGVRPPSASPARSRTRVRKTPRKHKRFRWLPF